MSILSLHMRAITKVPLSVLRMQGHTSVIYVDYSYKETLTKVV